MTLVLGVDPGKSGGMCLVNLDNSIIDLRMNPLINDPNKKPKNKKAKHPQIVDIYAFRDYLIEVRPHAVVIEKQQVRPKQRGIVANIRAWANLEGIVIGLGIELIPVEAEAWKKSILAPLGYETEGKQGAIDYFKTSNPGVSLFTTPRQTKERDGLADAYCLARYGVECLKERTKLSYA